MKRKLLILALGAGFLILMGWVGSVLSTVNPPPAAHVQATQAGPYQLTLQVDPNPPPTTQPATLSLQLLRKDTQEPVTNAHITIESTMEEMDMGTNHADVQSQNDGTYLSHLQFPMSGAWQLHVLISVPGSRTESALFEVTAQ